MDRFDITYFDNIILILWQMRQKKNDLERFIFAAHVVVVFFGVGVKTRR